MDIFILFWIFIIGILIGFLMGVAIIYTKVAIPIKKQKKSMAVLYGKITEQFAPFMKQYPYNAKKFRFIGSPIDGVQFEDDKIIFVEFKSAGGKLNEEQKKIKKLVEDKKVEWVTFEIKE